MVMGNASGKNNGEGTSGVKDDEGVYAEARSMGLLHPSLNSTPQVSTAALARLIKVNNVRIAAQENRDLISENLRAVMITWNHDGGQVAITGSWDNWSKREPLQKCGKEFVLMKMLPSGVYPYRFIVDDHFRYAPDLPWECDASGMAYNILDVQDYITDAPENLSEFDSLPSPESSYDNEFLYEIDHGKPPPEMPPQLRLTLLNNRSSTIDGNFSLARPQQSALNHLYIQNTRGQPVALGSTQRFLEKYVTVVLYKSSRRKGRRRNTERRDFS